MHMVRVITIMDDIYADLYKLKKAKGMSFSEVLRYLVHERGREGRSLINLAGSVSEMDVDRKSVDRVRKGKGVLSWKTK